jgi:hypothetical protein
MPFIPKSNVKIGKIPQLNLAINPNFCSALKNEVVQVTFSSFNS